MKLRHAYDFCSLSRSLSVCTIEKNNNNEKQTIELGYYRGGCIMCMDYGIYAAESYVRLVRLFEPIVQILTLQLFLLDYVGFDMSKGFLFGFSYGGQLAVEAGRRIGNQRIKDIDSTNTFLYSLLRSRPILIHFRLRFQRAIWPVPVSIIVQINRTTGKLHKTCNAYTPAVTKERATITAIKIGDSAIAV